MARGPDRTPDTQDLGRDALLTPLLALLRPNSVVRCTIGDDDGTASPEAAGAGATVSRCTPDTLADALEADAPDVVWIAGRPDWHSLRALAPVVIAHHRRRSADPPAVVVEGAPPDPVLPDGDPESYASHLARMESWKEGVRLGLADLAAALDPPPTQLWASEGRGVGILLPAPLAERLAPFVAGRAELLDAVRDARRDALRFRNRSQDLFELFRRSHLLGTDVVRSTRFRVGTRLVRLARSVRRQEALFRAPGEILQQKPVVDAWKARLADERRRAVEAPKPLEPGALRVTYVLPALALSGGVLVVAELVNELRLLGVDARIATLEDSRAVYRTRFLHRPMVFKDADALVRDLPPADIVVATHWSSASWVADLVATGRAQNASYLVQDYEVWFYREDDVEARRGVRESYELIPHKVATSAWLADLLRADGHSARTVPIGVDLAMFYPRPIEPPPHPVVVAMARPRTPRRAYDMVLAALERVHAALPDAEIVLFGGRLPSSPAFPHRDEGVVPDQERLAELYAGAHVHFDGSDYQAFGRPALEAMACGTVSVLTDVGGVNEYARHEQNCLLVPPRDPAAAASAIVRLLTDDALRGRLRATGFETIRSYSTARAAAATLAAFEDLRPG